MHCCCCCCCCCCCEVVSVVSESVCPHGRQPTRPRSPWGSPGKNTGVGCHVLLQCMKVKCESEVAQSATGWPERGGAVTTANVAEGACATPRRACARARSPRCCRPR